jgi:hypothetical protein
VVCIGRLGAGEITVLDLPASGWGGGTSAPQDYEFKSRTGVVISARFVAGGSIADLEYPVPHVVGFDARHRVDSQPVAAIRECTSTRPTGIHEWEEVEVGVALRSLKVCRRSCQ